jgi:hypothetical protein
MRLAVGAIVIVAALHAACGGVNMSDDQRLPSRAAPGERDDGDDDDRDAGRTPVQTDEADDASTPATVAPPVDAGTSSDSGTSAPIPEGSFAAGTDLETTANLNLRDGPAVTFAVILTIPIATVVKVQTTSGADGWVHVDHQGTIGYASKTFLKVP